MKTEKKEKITLIVFIVFFLLLTLLVMMGYTQKLDENLLGLLTDKTPRFISYILGLLTYMGSNFVLIPASLIIIALFYKADENILSYHFAGMMLLSGLVVVLVKYTIRRPRPSLNGVQYLVYGYPSGHTIGAFTFFIGIYVFYFLLYKQKHNVFYLSLCLIAPSVVAASRLVLRVHYLTDVIAGMLLSGILITIFWIKLRGRQSNHLGK